MKTQSSARKFKICLIVTNDMTSDSRVDRHAEALGLKGHEVVVLSRTFNTTLPRFERRRHYTILRYREPLLSCPIRSNATKSADLRQSSSRFYWRLGLALSRRIEASRHLSLTIAARIWLYSVALRLQAHVYHCNDLDTLDIGALMALTGRKLVYDSHELCVEIIPPTFQRALFSAFEKLLVKLADVVITVNPFIGRELERRYSLKRIHVVLNCPEATHRQETSSKVHGQSRVVTVLYHGGFHPSMGLENLILACGRFRKGVRLIMRGEDSQLWGPSFEARLRQVATGLSNITFQRKVPMDTVVESAMAADIGIIPHAPTNLNYYYCSPNKLFEYIQAGLVLAVSDLPFLRQIVIGNGIGVVFDPNDPDDIARQINLASTKKNLFSFKQKVNKIRYRYSWENEKKQLYTAYNDLESS